MNNKILTVIYFIASYYYIDKMLKLVYDVGYDRGEKNAHAKMYIIKTKSEKDGNVIKYPFKKESNDVVNTTTPPATN